MKKNFALGVAFLALCVGILAGALIEKSIPPSKDKPLKVYHLVLENGLVHTLAWYNDNLWIMDLIPLTEKATIIDVYKKDKRLKSKNDRVSPHGP